MTSASSSALQLLVMHLLLKTCTTTNATAPNATLVEFVSNIEQIRGHLDQAVINKEVETTP